MGTDLQIRAIGKKLFPKNLKFSYCGVLELYLLEFDLAAEGIYLRHWESFTIGAHHIVL